MATIYFRDPQTNDFIKVEIPVPKIISNPEDLSTEAIELTGLRINDNDYKIINSANIIPNPTEDSTETLNKININGVIYGIPMSNNFLILSGTLSAGSTSITLHDESITGEEMIEVFTDIYGVNPKTITSEVGSITLTFKEQANDMKIKVRCL